jgi:two-component system, LytTR family, response regulator
MNEKIKVLVIDDENLGREIVKKYLAAHNNVELVDECSNGFEGIKKINELKPDLVFLDIQMPKLTGFEMLELLEELPVIVFTTAYDQFALKAFEVNAADYLLKPFSQERFNEAVEKAMLHLDKKVSQKKLIQGLIKLNDAKKEYLERIVIKDGPKISIINTSTLKYIEAQDDYVMIYSDEGKHLKQKTMKYFEDHLNPFEFVRIHRSYICSVTEIKKIELLEKESYQVRLKNGTSLPVSKTGYAKLKEILNQ